MKKIISAATILLFAVACNHDVKLVDKASIHAPATIAPVPVALLNPAGESWKISPADVSSYAGPEKLKLQANSSVEKTLLEVKLEADESFRFKYQLKDNAMVLVQGKVSFRKKHGKDIFVLQPLSGTKTTAGKQSNLSSRELMDKYSTPYLWEKIHFDDMPREDFILLVNLDEHPMASAAKTGNIERSWVLKFYSR
jgi:hypothetical protein